MSIPTVVIITAISLEFEAVVAHLRDSKYETHQNTHYSVGEYVTPANRHWRVVVRKLNAMGNYEAAQESIDAISVFSPAYMFFVGVAGGLKEVQLCDVVAASMARGYESVKVEEGVIKQRLHVEYPSHQLVEMAFQLASQPDWKNKIIEPLGQPKAFVCPIASGEKVIASEQFLQQLQQCCSDAIAIEMEAIGFLRTFRKRPEVKGIVIRGISDMIVGKTSEHDKHWQPIAARHAAGFAFAMVDKLEISPHWRTALRWKNWGWLALFGIVVIIWLVSELKGCDQDITQTVINGTGIINPNKGSVIINEKP